MIDLNPPPGLPGWLWTIFAFIGCFGILGALIWVNLLIGGLINALVTLVSAPLIDKLLAKPGVVAMLGKFGIKDLV